MFRLCLPVSVIIIDKEDVERGKLMEDALEAGATDFLTDGDVFEVRTEPNDMGAVRDDLEAKGYKYLTASRLYSIYLYKA